MGFTRRSLRCRVVAAYRVAGGGESGLHLGDPHGTEVEHAGRQHGVRAGIDSGREVLGPAGAAGGDQRYVHHRPDGGDHLQVEAAGGAVGVHRVQQDLPHPQIDAASGPLDRVDAGAPSARRGW